MGPGLKKIQFVEVRASVAAAVVAVAEINFSLWQYSDNGEHWHLV